MSGKRVVAGRVGCAIVACLLLASCSMLFPYVEMAIAPEGTTLDELGLALVADVEQWVTSVLWLFGLVGL